MRKTIVALLLLLCTVSVYAADAAEEARQAEIAFAKAFADRDSAKFLSFVADDANFISKKSVLTGRAQVAEGWAPLLTSEKPPFRWAPERVFANAAGNLALSTGPIHDPEGKLIGYYSSVWQKQGDGSWKVIFDGPGSAPPCESAK